MKVTIASLFALLLISVSFARIWTNREGQTVEAELVKIVDDKTIQIRVAANGALYDYAIGELSDADQAYVAEKRQEEQDSKRKEMLADRNAKWHEDYEDAVAEAKALDLPIYFLFTGSEWCGYCIQLEDEVLSQREFEGFADQNLVLMKADLHRDGWRGRYEQQNRSLADKYSVTGYPTVLLLNAEGESLGRLGGYKSGEVEAYLQLLQRQMK
ncbi:MAG: thioredoxin family protein [Opitutales bacterium]